MTFVAKTLKDPLIHFLLLGTVIFAGYRLVQPNDQSPTDPRQIVVDRKALLEFIQYRTKRFDPDTAAARLTAMDTEALADLVEAYVREEALYREAKALALDRNDYVIKQRLVQTVEFIAGETTAGESTIADEDLATWYEAQKDRYAEPEAITFTHVFVASDGKDLQSDTAALRARALLDQLRSNEITFADAGRYGDLFTYQRNYVDRTQEDISSHFGDDFAAQLFTDARQNKTKQWTGPIESAYGHHLVLIAAHRPLATMPFESVRRQITIDLLEHRKADRRNAVIDEVLSQYEVDLRLEDTAVDIQSAPG